MSDGPVLAHIKKDKDCTAFGLQGIQDQPMAVAAKLLPQAKLSYAGNQVVDPGLSGSWNSLKFKHLPPAMAKDGYMYGVMVVCDRNPRDMVSQYLFISQYICLLYIFYVSRSNMWRHLWRKLSRMERLRGFFFAEGEIPWSPMIILPT